MCIVNGRKKKAFFVDGMTDHFDNFIKRMEKREKRLFFQKQKKRDRFIDKQIPVCITGSLTTIKSSKLY